MKQRKFITFLMVLLLCVSASSIYAQEAVINIQYVGHHGTHSEYYPPADMPEVYFNSADQEIILIADGFSSYYNVEITLTTSYIPLISTQVDGYGDTIDVSSLPDGYYVIVITSEYNNVYQGYFNNY